MSDKPKNLVRLDPESEACLREMSSVIAEEIAVRIALGEKNVNDPDWVSTVSELAADALLDAFIVRRRAAENPRYRWEDE